MLLRLSLSTFVCILFWQAQTIAQDAAVSAETAPPAVKPEKLELQDGDSIVFLGDSITHQCLYTQYVEDYFYTRFPQLRLKLHNAGVGGARAWDALQRFDADVAAYHPKYVTILLGMNDGSYRPYDEATFQTYRQDMTTLLDRLSDIGARPIPMTPTMYDSRAKRLYGKPGTPEDSVKLYNSVLAYYGTWLREMSNERGLNFVNMWGPLNDLTLEGRETDAKFTLIRDAVHPDAPGQVVMATAIVNDLELPTVVSAVQLQKGIDGTWQGTAENAALTDIEGTGNAVSFQLTAKSLPWVLPENAALGVQLTELGHRLSRESLQVSGLEPGTYALLIANTEVGTYTAQELGAGVELEGNSKTPQYQQALKVAELNKRRNEGPVRGLRGEWGKFQNFARLKQSHTQNPDNAEITAKFEAAEKAVSGMEERVAEFNAAAKAIEDEIFQINQPHKEQYRLEKRQ